ncbi:tetratricopeptide repeat protein [Streptomyces sp. AS02]|uniref:NB-ARC domain-containing protein n=1 Tax=Streptomyces sp. AS02 TaxID=2938946 RepID=UPI0020201593|nr:tetratricopeptide repeat protein [Streptomyces sp. AS02]MCL8013881.1 NB-ARC domain-containing protein [Streptomyces sp. AS02]
MSGGGEGRVDGVGEGRAGGAVDASGERAIAAAGSIRQALTGDGAVAYYVEKSLTLPADALEPPPQAPPGMVNLPGRTGLFVGRQRELARLDEAFGNPEGSVVVHAVHGLGGIGKSTLAANWAARWTASYNPVWWITAETPGELESGLAGLAVALQPTLRDVLSQEALAERAVQWLAAHQGWLLVLDNVSDPADVRPLLARMTGGRFLITSRRASGWHGIARPLSLDVLEPSEAVELFERIHGGSAEGIEELCGELGFLPLAVEQAAAYCAEARITPRAYRELLARYPERVFANAAEGGDGARTIARVWQVTMDRLADTPVAEDILRVVAWWAPDGIPRAGVADLGEEPEVTEALRRLAAHSMITLHEDGTFSVHRLVQAVSRVGEVADDAREMAAGVLNDLAEEIPDTTWLTHAEALAEHARGETPGQFEILLSISVGNWYVAHLSYARAAELHETAMAFAERILGRRHEVTLIACQALAQRCEEMGDRDRAMRLQTDGLDMTEAVFGRDAPQTFEARTSLAELKLQLGDLDGGLSLAEENARRAAHVLGEDAEETHGAQAALATGWHLMAKSDPARHAVRASTEIGRLLTRAVRSGGEHSVQARRLLWELGRVHEVAGDLAGAIRLTEEYVERFTVPPGGSQVPGLLARHRIVLLLREAGELRRARELAVPLLAELDEAFDAEAAGRLRGYLAPLFTPDAGG